MKLRTCVVLALASALAACNVAPTVRYRQINDETHMAGMTDAYFLQRSEIEIASPATGKDGGPGAISIASNPRESQRKFGIQAQRTMLSSTKINVVKFENTDLVKSIGVETTDDTLKMIGEVGGVIVKLLPILAAAPPAPGTKAGTPGPCVAPGETLRYEVMTDPDTKDSKTYKVPGKDCVEVAVGPVPPDALKWSEVSFDQDTSMFLYSACRTATISVVSGPNDSKTTKVLKISDPNFVQMVQFPFKGAISMHTQCGASVTTEKAASDTTASAILSALLVQAKAIDDARKAAESASAAGSSGSGSGSPSTPKK